MEVEYISSHIEGTRLFSLDCERLLLRSISAMDIWLPNEIKVSQCNRSPGHRDLKPEPECTCGIWSCKSRKNLFQVFPPSYYIENTLDPYFVVRRTGFPQFFSARVEQWGVIIEHELGYRSEFARIIPHTIQVYPRTEGMRHAKLVKFLRKRYESGSSPTVSI